MSEPRRNTQPTSGFPYACVGQSRWRRHLRCYEPDLSQRLSRARLVYLRRHDGRWGWLTLCLLLFLQPVAGLAQDLNNPGAGTLLLGTQENPFIAPAPGLFSGDPVMFQVDLNDDGQNEYLLLFLSEYGITQSHFFYLTEEGWTVGSLKHTRWKDGNTLWRDAIRNGDIEVVDPRFRGLKIGDVLLLPVTN